jgi:hypothetical protein
VRVRGRVKLTSNAEFNGDDNSGQIFSKKRKVSEN